MAKFAVDRSRKFSHRVSPRCGDRQPCTRRPQSYDKRHLQRGQTRRGERTRKAMASIPAGPLGIYAFPPGLTLAPRFFLSMAAPRVHCNFDPLMAFCLTVQSVSRLRSCLTTPVPSAVARTNYLSPSATRASPSFQHPSPQKKALIPTPPNSRGCF